MVWLAFSQLSAKRTYHEGAPKSISMEAIWCYVDLVLDLTVDEVEDLLFFLQKLDDKFLETQNKRLEKSRNKAGWRRWRVSWASGGGLMPAATRPDSKRRPCCHLIKTDFSTRTRTSHERFRKQFLVGIKPKK